MAFTSGIEVSAILGSRKASRSPSNCLCLEISLWSSLLICPSTVHCNGLPLRFLRYACHLPYLSHYSHVCLFAIDRVVSFFAVYTSCPIPSVEVEADSIVTTKKQRKGRGHGHHTSGDLGDHPAADVSSEKVHITDNLYQWMYFSQSQPW